MDQSSPYPTIKHLIDAFATDAQSGRAKVADLTGASRNAVSNWYRTGVPYRYETALIEAAHARGIPGITQSSLRSLKEQAMSADHSDAVAAAD